MPQGQTVCLEFRIVLAIDTFSAEALVLADEIHPIIAEALAAYGTS